MKPPSLNIILATVTHASEMGLGRIRLELPENLLLVNKLSCRARVFGHEHRRRCACIGDQALDHTAYISSARFGESYTLLDTFGSEGHQASFNDVARVLDVGCEGNDLQHPTMIGVVQRVGVQ